MISLFCCPVCGRTLVRTAQTLRCAAGHSFDVAAGGYTHLLPANMKNSKSPGDDRAMVAARAAFLSKGYYAPLRDALCQLALRFAPENAVVLDAGCGEGYYDEGLLAALTAAGHAPHLAGIDISKFAVRRAAKRCAAGEFAVASSYRLPLGGGCCDLLLNCFSPLAVEEFRRVLKPGGCFFYVVPAARHLWQMKEILYDAPYPNEEKLTPYEGFSYVEVAQVGHTITLDTQEDIHALFQMTPYFWKTPRAGCERLAALSSLTTEIAFAIHVFKKQ